MEGEEAQPIIEQYPKYKIINDNIYVQSPIEMQEDILNRIIQQVTSTFREQQASTNLCKTLRVDLDRKYGPAWHVFIGKNFGAFAVHDKNAFVYFKYLGFTFLIYKTSI